MKMMEAPRHKQVYISYCAPLQFIPLMPGGPPCERTPATVSDGGVSRKQPRSAHTGLNLVQLELALPLPRTHPPLPLQAVLSVQIQPLLKKTPKFRKDRGWNNDMI